MSLTPLHTVGEGMHSFTILSLFPIGEITGQGLFSWHWVVPRLERADIDKVKLFLASSMHHSQIFCPNAPENSMLEFQTPTNVLSSID